MARTLVLYKYKPAACAEILKQGLASRREAVSATVAAGGGQMEHFWAVNSTEWHVAFIASGEATDAEGAASQLAYHATGYIERVAAFPLADVDDADEVMAAIASARPKPPGEG